MQSALVQVFLVTLCVAVYGNAVSGNGAQTPVRSEQRPRPATAPKAPAAPSTTSQRQEVQTTKSAQLVAVPVVVKSSSGNYVSDLGHNDFEILEDGVRQKGILFTPLTAPTFVVLILDTSISTHGKLRRDQTSRPGLCDKLQKAIASS